MDEMEEGLEKPYSSIYVCYMGVKFIAQNVVLKIGY